MKFNAYNAERYKTWRLTKTEKKCALGNGTTFCLYIFLYHKVRLQCWLCSGMLVGITVVLTACVWPHESHVYVLFVHWSYIVVWVNVILHDDFVLNFQICFDSFGWAVIVLAWFSEECCCIVVSFTVAVLRLLQRSRTTQEECTLSSLKVLKWVCLTSLVTCDVFIPHVQASPEEFWNAKNVLEFTVHFSIYFHRHVKWSKVYTVFVFDLKLLTLYQKFAVTALLRNTLTNCCHWQ